MAISEKKECSIVKDNLITFAENEMPQEAWIHLKSCESCALLVQGFTRAWRNPKPVERDMSPSFLPRLMERIALYNEPSRRRRNLISAAWRILRPVAVAAVLLAGIFAGYEMGKSTMTEPRPEKSVSPLVLDALESIPRGSLADFFIRYPISEKRKSDEK